RFLSAAGRWKPAADLTAPSDALDPDVILHETQARILAAVIAGGGRERPGALRQPSGFLDVVPAQLDERLTQDVQRLTALCAEWQEQGGNAAGIGAVLTLLGGHP